MINLRDGDGEGNREEDIESRYCCSLVISRHVDFLKTDVSLTATSLELFL